MKRLLMIIISLAWLIPMLADDYNPANPPEPQTPEDPALLWKVTTTASPMGYTSGQGSYVEGKNITISTSAYSSSYVFKYWEKDNEYYTDKKSFTYTVEAVDVNFVAVYDFNPVSPAEPQYDNTYVLNLTNNIASACSFNRTSGTRVEAGTWVQLKATKSEGFEFLGWYRNNVKVSDNLSFNYQMPAANVTLTAWFKYNPENPDEPNSSNEGEIENGLLGDVNGDGVVNTTDAVIIINYYVGAIPEINFSAADVNKDGVINATDAVCITNNYLNKE